MSTRTRTQAHAQRGYTLVEVLLVACFLPLLVAAVGKIVSSSGGMAEQSRADLHAHEELRKNLESVANIVRTADLETLDGFDGNGIATEPTFERVIGADEEGRLYDGAEQLLWVGRPDDIDGVQYPGVVVHRKAGEDTVVARHVPLGGFKVNLDAGTLVIRMTSYYVTSSRKVSQVSSETAVALRN